MLSHVRLFVTPWTVACQAPLCMGFPRQECWSGLPFFSPGDLSSPGIELTSPALAGKDSLPLSHLRLHSRCMQHYLLGIFAKTPLRFKP